MAKKMCAKLGGGVTLEGTALEGDVVSGKTFYNTDAGEIQTGTRKQTGTYTYASGSTGGTIDLGEQNTYRYVNASNVYTKGKADGDIKHTVKVWQPHSGGGSSDDYEIYVVIDGTIKYHNYANSFGNKSWTV